jgi:hypothetical protein
MLKPTREIKMTWGDLGKRLQKDETILRDEEISGITLVKPRSLLIYLQRGQLRKEQAEQLAKEVQPEKEQPKAEKPKRRAKKKELEKKS